MVAFQNTVLCTFITLMTKVQVRCSGIGLIIQAGDQWVPTQFSFGELLLCPENKIPYTPQVGFANLCKKLEEEKLGYAFQSSVCVFFTQRIFRCLGGPVPEAKGTKMTRNQHRPLKSL